MCGFAAIVGTRTRPLSGRDLTRVGATIEHRGPDDAGMWCDGRTALVFRRLAIIDLTAAGHQPMESEDGRVVLVFNGEIYNYIELRRELRLLGFAFRSESDTEVLLRAYQAWGTECLRRLNGMFAFVIVDGRRDLVFAARDRFGIKPLYSARLANGHLALASEIKALRALGAGRAPDWSRVSEWLVGPSLDQQPAYGRTFFEGIEEVAAGTALLIDADGQARTWEYWSLDGIVRGPHPDPVEEFRTLFEDSVRLQARADVPLGVSLSGGLDSTAIICALAREQGTTIEAFSYLSEQHDEREYISATLAQTGARLNVVPISPARLFDDLDHLLVAHDEPVHSLTAAIGYEIMRAARARGITVMLGGQGADEVLAGYGSYFADYWPTLIVRNGERAAREAIAAHCAVHGGDAATQFAAARYRVTALTRRRWIPGYTSASRARTWLAQRRQPGIAPEILRQLPWHADEFVASSLSASLRHAVTAGTLPFYLRLEDRNAMAHGVEGRVPFLDHRLVELAFSVREKWLLRGPWNKYLLRESLRGRIPENVRTRPEKFGFPHPAQAWFAGPLHDRVADVFTNPVGADLYDVRWARRLLAEHRAGVVDHSRMLFRLVQLERWLASVVHAEPLATRVYQPPLLVSA